MNEGLFSTQINQIAIILNRYDLLFERNHFPDYRECGAAKFRNIDYRKVWEIYFAEKFYNFVLQDNSLIQFRADFKVLEFHYGYFESPQLIISYTDFLISECGFSVEELQDIGDEFRQDYEIYITTSDQKDAVTPVRYDYEPVLYHEARHPASHIHFGHNCEVRIGTKKILRPLSFIEFILRQYYPDKWVEFLTLEENKLLCRNVRENLDDVDNNYWNPLDEFEMVLW